MLPSEAWAAGLFEGEGTVTHRGSNAGWAAALSTTDLDVALAFAKVTGVGKVYGPYVVTHKRLDGDEFKPYWKWTVANTRGVRDFLTRFGPYMGERRAQKFAEVLTALESVGRYRPPREDRPGAKIVWSARAHDWTIDFLEAYAELHSIKAAAMAIGVSKTQVYYQRGRDIEFDQKVRALMPAGPAKHTVAAHRLETSK